MGTEEGDVTDNSQMKDKLVKEYYCWIQQILKAELNSKISVTAINTLAVPALVYSFKMVKWFRKEIEKIDRKTRKLKTN
jgi:TRAP-type mannitol/chloroaromatic compound transport system substrate-binding protein